MINLACNIFRDHNFSLDISLYANQYSITRNIKCNIICLLIYNQQTKYQLLLNKLKYTK